MCVIQLNLVEVSPIWLYTSITGLACMYEMNIKQYFRITQFILKIFQLRIYHFELERFWAETNYVH